MEKIKLIYQNGHSFITEIRVGLPVDVIFNEYVGSYIKENDKRFNLKTIAFLDRQDPQEYKAAI